MIHEIIQNGNSYNIVLVGNKEEILGDYYSFINHSAGKFVPEIKWVNDYTATTGMSKSNFNRCIMRAELAKILNLADKVTNSKEDVMLAKNRAADRINSIKVKSIDKNIEETATYKTVDGAEDMV